MVQGDKPPIVKRKKKRLLFEIQWRGDRNLRTKEKKEKKPNSDDA